MADHRRSLWGHHGKRSGGALTKKWSDALVERSVSSWLLDPEPSDTDDDRVALSELRNLVNRELNTVGDVKGLTSDIRKWGKGRALSERLKQVFDTIIFEELEQILDDIDWASSARGKFIVFVNDYVQELYRKSEFRSDPMFADVYVGAHSMRNEIVVTGAVASEGMLNKVRSIMRDNDPGIPVSYQVTLKKC